jgi:ABC-type multidrug transport system fused ATPase/permease subunit
MTHQQPAAVADRSTRAIFTRFWADFLRRYKRAFVAVGVLMVLSVVLQLPAPILTMHIVDAAVAGSDLNRISQLALLFAGLIVLRHVFAFINERSTLVLKENIILELELHLVRHLHRLPLSFLSRHHSTYLQSRVMNDVRAVEGALVRTIVTILINVLTFIVGIGFVTYVRPELALILVAFLVPFGFIRYYANQRMRALSTEMQEKQAVASAAMSESLAGVRTIKAFGGHDVQGSAVARHLRNLRDIYIRTNWFGIVSTVGTGLITSLCIAFVLWYGARAVLLGTMSVGQVVGILGFLNFLYTPINSLVAANLSVQQSTAAIQRLYEFLNEAPEREGGAVLPAVAGRVDIRDVRFSYAGAAEVLKGISLEIEAGSTVAIVGRSGAGKSTLVNLLARFYEAQEGEVRLDGVDVRSLDLAFLRQSIGIVDQQTFLFSGTVFDNIRFGNPDATAEEVVEAARRSFAHDFIEALPDKYETSVGERGLRLSGGQAQRIALARMFLKNPRVLILDEAVSAVDSESESAIQDALVPLARDRTTIIIAHRLSSLLQATEVILVDDGVVVERGSHAELVERDGLYARIFREQFKPELNGKLVVGQPLIPA